MSAEMRNVSTKAQSPGTRQHLGFLLCKQSFDYNCWCQPRKGDKPESVRVLTGTPICVTRHKQSYERADLASMKRS